MDTGDLGTEEKVTFPHALPEALAPEYILRRWLGSGAFGDVFEACQESTGQAVAIKLLRATESGNARERFRLEMRACAALNHPHVVRLLDAGRDNGDPKAPLFTVYEYVPGDTLADRLARHGMLTVKDAVELMGQVLDGLHAAHRIGIVHRDLKPANIMVTETVGRLHAKILDFGIATWSQSSREAGGVRLTQSGERVGTPAYCAPEQLRGEPTNALVDYYAWGLILLECLTGEHAFGKCAMHEVLYAQFSPDPIPIPKLLATHPLGDILRWTLEKDSTRRASDAGQVLTRLARLSFRGLVDDGGFLLGNTSTSAAGDPASRDTDVGPLIPPQSERRPLTALCCRIGFERALYVDDEEAFDGWLDDLREMMIQSAERNGGRCGTTTGAEFVVYFGLDASEEASTRQAARAALEIRDHAVRRTNLMRAQAGWNIDVRIGLHQGMVTVKDRREHSAIMGATAIIASRLCELAAPGEIAASEATVSFLLDMQQVEIQPEDRVLGSAWYRLSSELNDGRSSAPYGPDMHAKTIGREAELERLARFWQDDAQTSLPCVVLSGPAGIGKTHLARHWQRQLSANGYHLLEARCLPETQGSALYPILRLVRERLGLDGCSREEATRLVEAFITRDGIDPAQNMALLCTWLGLPLGSWSDLAVSPKKKREQFIALMARLVARLAPAPCTLFLEDIHWADPTTVEWLRLLIDSNDEPRPMLCCTLRTGALATDLESRTIGKHAHSELTTLLEHPRTQKIELAPLDELAARELLATVCGPDVDAAPLVQRGAGVPFFLLELVRCRAGVREFVVPPSIAELLRVRMDRLGTAKETAQLAAVLGPEFDYELISELSLRGSELLGDLNHLTSAGMIGLTPTGRYVFAHSLLRDAAYQSLLRKDRQRLHACVASSLLAHDPELERTKPWLLAFHFYRAGETERGLAYGESAAAQALLRFDNLEALGYVRELRGTDPESPAGWLRDVGESAKRSRVELRLLAVEATALMLTRGWADRELSRTCQRATELFVELPNEETLQMRYVLAQYYFSTGWTANPATGDDQRARPRIDALIEAANACGARSFQGLGRMMLAAWYLFQGRLESSIATARSVERGEDTQEAWKYGYDAFLCARSIEFQARWFRGDADVWDFIDETVKLAEAFGHPATLANVKLYLLTPLSLAGKRAETVRICDQILGLCDRYGLQGFPAYALIFKGWAVGDPSLARGAFDALAGAGQRLCEVFCSMMLAESELDAGSTVAAAALIATSEELAVQTGERYILPRVLMLKARCAFRREPSRAAALMNEAVTLATSQGAYGMLERLRAEASDFSAVPLQLP
jgi:TOMM system kinase/cyclase fusion protein